MGRTRGRPRKYEEDEALAAAGRVFWTKGFEGTSLDELSATMGMNRPSIYRAFGNKQAVYRKALRHFAEGMEAAFARTMLAEDDIRAALRAFYREAVATYTEGDPPRGCLVMSTAVAAATTHPEVRNDLLATLRGIDRKLARRMQQAIDDGQLEPSPTAADRAAVAQAVLHTLSLRARAGETRRQLRRILEAGVDMVLARGSARSLDRAESSQRHLRREL